MSPSGFLIDVKSPMHSATLWAKNFRTSEFRTTGNPSLTRRWSFGRVTEGLPTTGSNAPPTRNRQFETVREKPCLLWRLVEVLRHSDGSVESTLSDEYSQSIA